MTHDITQKLQEADASAQLEEHGVLPVADTLRQNVRQLKLTCGIFLKVMYTCIDKSLSIALIFCHILLLLFLPFIMQPQLQSCNRTYLKGNGGSFEMHLDYSYRYLLRLCLELKILPRVN